MNLKRVVTTISVAILLFAVIGGDKAFALSLAVQKGEKYNIHMSNEQETVVTFNNQEMTAKQKMDMDCSMNVLDVDKDKNVTIGYSYDAIKILADSAGEKIAYDSNQDDNSNPFSSIYSGILGKTFTVKLDSKGKVLEIKGLGDIINSTIDNAPGTGQQKQALKKSLEQSFNDESLKLMFQQSMNNYPPSNVKVGDTWEDKNELNVIFPMVIASKYKFSSEKDGMLTVNMKSTINADTQNNPIDIMGIKANVVLNGEINGNINMNKKNVFLQNENIIQHISGEMEIQTGTETPQTITLPLAITSTITCEITKK
jgi:hypothetical protein